MARSSGATVLITLADVETAVRLNAQLEAAGTTTSLVSPLDNFAAEVRRAHPELIVVTGNIADPGVLQVVRDQLWEGTAVIGLADVADPHLIERLRQIGFVDVYTKPIDADDLFDAVRRVLERRRLAESTGLVGQSDSIREVLVKVEQMAPVSSTVLVQGESGTGKELVARAIHQLSPRRGRPFIAVNVGALPETLLESELFGHEKGAFTGAAERRIGRFELADTGTLFLDEIGDIPPATQVKLLRVLEEREVTRVGGTTPIHVNVRVVTASNQPLRQLVEEGRFRSDLYYRLNVLAIYLPPLRERREDIPLLVRRFVRQFSSQHDRPFHGISADAMEILVSYGWPGNVRQLKNLIESMVVLAPGREITAADIPSEVRDGVASLLPVRVPQVVVRAGEATAGGRELEFIVHSLMDLRLQMEELRRRVDAVATGQRAIVDAGELGRGGADGRSLPSGIGALEPPAPPPANVLTV
ncbi:MAG TPA: sigma-54 dependent transcriptional regulator, partial [Candidatus Elarobacter sp.]|nr:sigma-54 dependent transcriptional regulator [Candidatus Elarobacter sp.]